MKLLVATNNKGKVAEINRILTEAGLEIVTPLEAGLPADFDVEETGTTYEENATLKAVAFAKATGMYAIADDSGLAVDALNGEPGVYSKRYAGEGKTDRQRNEYLLSKLENIPDDQLTASFIAVITLADSEGNVVEHQMGVCPGRIIRQARGSNGFGYDPIFLVDGENNKTMAELSNEDKDRVSHRGRALRQLLPTLKKITGR